METTVRMDFIWDSLCKLVFLCIHVFQVGFIVKFLSEKNYYHAIAL